MPVTVVVATAALANSVAVAIALVTRAGAALLLLPPMTAPVFDRCCCSRSDPDGAAAWVDTIRTVLVVGGDGSSTGTSGCRTSIGGSGRSGRNRSGGGSTTGRQ